MEVYKSIGIKSLLLTVALLLVAGSPILAEEDDKGSSEIEILEEMVVTATRTEVALEEVTKSIEVVTSEDIEEQQQYFMPELLDNLPGVFLRKTGGMGQWSLITIRGASERHTLFQYNGMPLRDSGDPQNTLSYFIGDLFGTSNLDRIEVLKGNNSTLHGSQAMGGVINFIPKKWQDGFTGELRSEFGPNNTYTGNARLAYGQENYYIDFNPMYVTTDGEKYGGDHGFYYDNIGLTFGAGIKPSDLTSLEFSAMAYDSDLALGSSPSLDANGKLIKQQADPDDHREGQLYQLGLIWNHEISPLWDYSLKGSYGSTERHYFIYDIESEHSDYDGETTYLEMQHNLHLFDWLTLNIGADYEEAVYDGQEPSSPSMGDYTPIHIDEKWGTWDLFAQAQFALLDRSLFLTLGGRYNDPEAFDEKLVWEASGAYILKSTRTKFHAHVGTGYRTPSLYETFGGYVYMGVLYGIGNEDLEPEESIGYEFGIDQSLLDDKVKVGATYFHTRFEDRIGFDMFQFKYANANKTKLSGVEAYINAKPFTWLKLNLAYTYTDTEAEDDNGDWVRGTYQPRNKVDFVATVYPTDKLTIACDIGYLDEKIVPLNWGSVLWEEDDRWTVDLSGTYNLLNFLDVFVRVENLFDEDYTESGFYMPGQSLYGGVRLNF